MPHGGAFLLAKRTKEKIMTTFWNMRAVANIALLLCSVAALAPSAAAQAPAETIRVGAAQTDITWHVGRGGLRGVHSRQWARAIVIDGPEPFAIARADLWFITGSLYESVVQRVEESTGIPPERVLVAATHAHVAHDGTSPHVGQSAYTGSADPMEKEFVAEGIARAIELAHAGARPATLAVGSGSIAYPAYNRRYWTNALTNEHGVPAFLDPELGVLRFDDAETGKPLAVLMNYGLHPVVAFPRDPAGVTSDFVGFTERALEASLLATTGEAPMAMWMNGATGDQNPIYVKTGYAEAEWTGRALAAEAARVVAELQPEPLLEADVTEKVIPLPEPGLGDPTDPNDLRVPWTAAPLTIPSSARLQAIGFSTPSSNTVLLSWPGEPIRDIGVDLKARAKALGFDHAFVLGLANDWGGYWLTKDEHERLTNRLQQGRAQLDWERPLAFYGSGSAAYISDHLINLADALHNDDAIVEQVPLPPHAQADRTLTSKLAEAAIAAGGHQETGPPIADDAVKAISGPVDIDRSEVTIFEWQGGSPNVASDWIPQVSVQRKRLPEQASEHSKHADEWVTVAREGTGEVLLRLKQSVGGTHRWSATWQPLFDADAGTYRFLVEGRRQNEAFLDEEYDLRSETFAVRPCACLRVNDSGLATQQLESGGVHLSVPIDYQGFAGDSSFRWLPTRVTSGAVLVDVIQDGIVLDAITLEFVPQPGTKEWWLDPNDDHKQNDPLTVVEPIEAGTFQGTWYGDPHVSFEIAHAEDAYGNYLQLPHL